MGFVDGHSGIPSLGDSPRNYTLSPGSPSVAINAGGIGSGAAPENILQDVATIPVFSKLEVLKASKPSEFQQVLTDAVTKLTSAAKQTSDPFAASFLWDLANGFQLTLNAGDALAVPEASHPDAASGPKGAENPPVTR